MDWLLCILWVVWMLIQVAATLDVASIPQEALAALIEGVYAWLRWCVQ